MGLHIILISDRRPTRTITMTQTHLAALATAFVLLVVGLSSAMSYFTVRHAAQLRLPFLQDVIREITLEESSKTRALVRDNLSELATRLGQMQAQLMQLDNLGERLAAMAGVKPKELDWSPKTWWAELGRTAQNRGDAPTTQEIEDAAAQLARALEMRGQLLSTIEDRLMESRIRAQLVPSAAPVVEGALMSGFGTRVDPFTGKLVMHEGIDFAAEVGTPILAAAAGIVVSVEKHPEYGNYVELDHGQGLTTRYAHAQSVLVKVGEIVRRGQQIATVGSSGRTTGPHLHFEIRKDGVAQNPARYLGRSGGLELARR
ncbi:MAG: M23 family metallopeptidase [Rhodocyclaceae bacterium]|nr:M23 family metallopeptidase [Rhodocyclaceae bacterium]